MRRSLFPRFAFSPVRLVFAFRSFYCTVGEDVSCVVLTVCSLLSFLRGLIHDSVHVPAALGKKTDLLPPREIAPPCVRVWVSVGAGASLCAVRSDVLALWSAAGSLGAAPVISRPFSSARHLRPAVVSRPFATHLSLGIKTFLNPPVALRLISAFSAQNSSLLDFSLAVQAFLILIFFASDISESFVLVK